MEFCYGSLEKIVFSKSAREKLTDQDLLKYATGIAAGLSHIAKEGLVHRDCACRNVLLTKDGKPKISDCTRHCWLVVNVGHM